MREVEIARNVHFIRTILVVNIQNGIRNTATLVVVVRANRAKGRRNRSSSKVGHQKLSEIELFNAKGKSSSLVEYVIKEVIRFVATTETQRLQKKARSSDIEMLTDERD